MYGDFYIYFEPTRCGIKANNRKKVRKRAFIPYESGSCTLKGALRIRSHSAGNYMSGTHTDTHWMLHSLLL